MMTITSYLSMFLKFCYGQVMQVSLIGNHFSPPPRGGTFDLSFTWGQGFLRCHDCTISSVLVRFGCVFFVRLWQTSLMVSVRLPLTSFIWLWSSGFPKNLLNKYDILLTISMEIIWQQINESDDYVGAIKISIQIFKKSSLCLFQLILLKDIIVPDSCSGALLHINI